MKPTLLATAALNQTPLDWAGNLENILEAIAQARQADAKILCLPELCLTGYGCGETFAAPHVAQKALELLLQLLPKTQGLTVTVGLPLQHEKALYNTVAVVSDGKLLGFAAKKEFSNGPFLPEDRWFSPWEPGKTVEVTLEGSNEKCHLGDALFESSGIKFAVEIGESAQSRPQADLVLNPTAVPFTFGKMQLRRKQLAKLAKESDAFYLSANLLGNEAGRAIYDGAALIVSGQGNILAETPRFSYQDLQLVTAADSGSSKPATLPTWETSPNIKHEEFTRAIALGLFDYARKIRCKGYVVSLSGGADSATIAVLAATSLKAAKAELGEKKLLQKIQEPCLTCAYQPSKNSSETTKNAATKLAEALGANFYLLPIGDLIQSYVDLVEKAVGKNLTWEEDDLALQNIQARARVPGIWLLANVQHALLLATGNRSEVAVGYATLDGDTCGGLAPIAAIDKFYLLQWLAWMRDHGPEGLAGAEAVPALKLITDQAPTAELRPPEANQRDEDDLMPYQALTMIEEMAIRRRMSPQEVLEAIKQEPKADGVTDKLLTQWVRCFFQRWSQSQWKRERGAPAFHLDDIRLDPLTWGNFPILSGAYAEELKELE